MRRPILCNKGVAMWRKIERWIETSDLQLAHEVALAAAVAIILAAIVTGAIRAVFESI
jgi:hypothetical protein